MEYPSFILSGMKPESESEVFKTSPSAYLRQVIRRKFIWPSVISAAIVLTAFILSFYDIRWAFMGLIFIFLIIPMVVFNAYFFYLLKPEAVRSIGLKSVCFLENGSIRIKYFRKDDDGNPEYADKSETIAKENIEMIEDGDKNIVIHLTAGRPDFIIVPRDAIDAETFNRLIFNDKQNQMYN